MYFIQTLLTDPILYLRFVVIIIISVCLHELAHGFVAISQGDDTPQKTGHLTLDPLVHMGALSLFFLCVTGIAWGAMPINPDKFRFPKWSNILVSLAGPLMNLAIAFLSIGLMKITLGNSSLQFISLGFLYLVARINLILCVFNLMPIPPLDGFHVVSEFFPTLKPLADGAWSLVFMMTLFTVLDFKGLNTLADSVIKAIVG